MPLPTDRTVDSTKAEHVDDHNTVHGFVNGHEADPAAHSGTLVPAVALWLPGISSNDVSTPHSAALSIAGDLDLRIEVALDDWTSSPGQELVSKWQGATQRSYSFTILANTAVPALQWTEDGATPITKSATANLSALADGEKKWLRATLDVDNGASGHDVTFFTSDDEATWTQLGGVITTAGVTNVFQSTAQVLTGTKDRTANQLKGNIHYVEIRNGIDGPVVGSYRGDIPATRYRDPQGNLWTVNGTANAWMTV